MPFGTGLFFGYCPINKTVHFSRFPFPQRIAMTVGDNGFVVGANPRGASSEIYKINGGLSVLSNLEYVPGRVWGYGSLRASYF